MKFVILLLLFSSCLGDFKDTNEWVIQLKDGIDPRLFALDHSLHYEHAVKHLDGYHVFTTTKGVDHYELEHSLAANNDVQWSKRQVARKQHTRNAQNAQREVHSFASRYGDPFYGRQWHLHGENGYSVQADKVWADGYTGRGVTIAIVDDGLQINHPDLSANVDRTNSYDYNGRKADPSPRSSDGHGTR